ncbi:MAG: hypothetical protein SFU56_03075 [Capsulimonadales bacterium]|nr:hypothetical protein [Capsulimonadales bacterium]
MAFAPAPYVEHPNLRTPIALIVDDPAPCINPLWYFRHQVDGEDEPAHERTIPLDFMRDWCEWVAGSGIRGDFTVLPFPAGLGRIDQGLSGFDSGEVREWLSLARTYIAPRFDIHCEILTHTNALDLATERMLPIGEHDWIDRQDEATLTAYFTTAMRILREADLPNHGLTQPCTYNGDESMYARAILAAEKAVNGRSVTHNFLHVDGVSHFVPPRLTYLDESAGEAVVSVWSAMDDYLWNTQERGSPEGEWSPERLADRFLTADGKSGRLIELLNGGGPMVTVTHWQSLYSNGSQRGFAAYREVVARVEAFLGERVAWRKLSEIADQTLMRQTVRFHSTATADRVEVDVSAPFGCEVLTVSIPMPWPLFSGPAVEIDGVLQQWVAETSQMAVGTWCMRGSVVTVSLSIAANVARRIAVSATWR